MLHVVRKYAVQGRDVGNVLQRTIRRMSTITSQDPDGVRRYVGDISHFKD